MDFLKYFQNDYTVGTLSSEERRQLFAKSSILAGVAMGAVSGTIAYGIHKYKMRSPNSKWYQQLRPNARFFANAMVVSTLSFGAAEKTLVFMIQKSQLERRALADQDVTTPEETKKVYPPNVYASSEATLLLAKK